MSEYFSVGPYLIHDEDVITVSRRADKKIKNYSPPTKPSPRGGLVEHYFKSMWFQGTEPTRRVIKDPFVLVPARKKPKTLIPLAFDIAFDGLTKQYEYFILGIDPWE